MGTTLTGTTPQDTYDSLIKVTDNGPLSGTAKYLSDGLGNDSALALSTGNIGIGTTSPSTKLHVNGGNTTVSGVSYPALILDSDASAVNFSVYSASSNDYLGISNGTINLAVFKTSGNVGIGTTNFEFWGFGNFGGTPITQKLATANTTDSVGVAVGSSTSSINFATLNATSSLTTINRIVSTTTDTTNNSEAGHLAFFVKSGATSTASEERFRVTANGVTFNGDTAAANALDDYEEGTWTMGVSFGGASVGVTTSSNTGTYTKIGRQVTVNGVLVLTSKGSSTGAVLITGLPFTIANSYLNYSTVTVRLENISFANQFQAYGGIGSTVIALDEITEAGVNGELTNSDFADNSTVMVSLTYFV
jgi:hypothetical protein